MQSGGLPRILATSDVHSPRYLPEFRNSLNREHSVCVFIFAGDIVDRGNVEAARPVFEAVRSLYPEARLVAVYGNEEYHDRAEAFRKQYPYVDWLDDELEIYACGKRKVAVVGTRGAIQRLTTWQRRHMPWLEKTYRERPRIISGLLEEAREKADYTILVSHYALARATIIGEPRRVWPYLYSPLMERVVTEQKPDAAVHGHAHKGKPRAVVAGVPVYNVAFPLNRKPVRVMFKITIDMFESLV